MVQKDLRSIRSVEFWIFYDNNIFLAHSTFVKKLLCGCRHLLKWFMVSQIFLFSRQMNLLEEFAANVGATKSIKNKFINNEFLTLKAGKKIHSDCFFSFCLSDKLNQTPNRFPNLKVKRRKFSFSLSLSLSHSLKHPHACTLGYSLSLECPLFHVYDSH